jgi:hypothetical protein
MRKSPSSRVNGPLTISPPSSVYSGVHGLKKLRRGFHSLSSSPTPARNPILLRIGTGLHETP